MSQPLTRTSQSYILSIRQPLEELLRRTGITQQELWASTRYIQYLDVTLEYLWYACLHREMTLSALMNVACRYQDVGHPFAVGVMSFGQLLQHELEQFGFYVQSVFLNTYHYNGRHGKWAIIIKRNFDDQLKLVT